MPPMFLEEKAKQVPPSQSTSDILSGRILYEDAELLIINKPCGMSVHAGSTVRVGVVEALRHMYPKLVHLELAHRLDSETTGCLILAKKRRVLKELHTLLREGEIRKILLGADQRAAGKIGTKSGFAITKRIHRWRQTRGES